MLPVDPFLGSLVRLEVFMLDCSSYVQDTTGRIAVASSYLSLTTNLILFYLSMCVLVGQSYLLFYFVLSEGLLIQSFFVWLLTTKLPALEMSPPACNPTANVILCGDAAIYSFLVVYYLMYGAVSHDERVRNKQHKTETWHIWMHYTLLFAYLVAGCWAQVYLQLYTAPQVIIGACLGAIDSVIVSSLLYWYIIPNMQNPVLDAYFRYFGITQTHVL